VTVLRCAHVTPGYLVSARAQVAVWGRAPCTAPWGCDPAWTSGQRRSSGRLGPRPPPRRAQCPPAALDGGETSDPTDSTMRIFPQAERKRERASAVATTSRRECPPLNFMGRIMLGSYHNPQTRTQGPGSPPTPPARAAPRGSERRRMKSLRQRAPWARHHRQPTRSGRKFAAGPPFEMLSFLTLPPVALSHPVVRPGPAS
jgi:hypothetical protein